MYETLCGTWEATQSTDQWQLSIAIPSLQIWSTAFLFARHDTDDDDDDDDATKRRRGGRVVQSLH